MLEIDGHWNLFKYEIDLFTGWRNIYRFQMRSNSDLLTVSYEDLVQTPRKTHFEGVCDFLNIPRTSAGLSQGTALLEGRMGDKNGVERYAGISSKSLDLWRTTLAPSTRANWVRQYLTDLGAERLSHTGYDLSELLEQLRSNAASPKPSDIAWRAWGVAYRNLNAGGIAQELRRHDLARSPRGLS